jgi:Ca2+-binding EF-hand superfamily protein
MEDQTSSSDAALSRAQFRLGFLQALIYPPNDVTGIEAADELFDAFDTDGSGSCDMTELISGIAAFTGDDSGELLKTIFSVFDADNNGTLSREEMETFIRSSLLVATLRAPAPAKEATSAAAAPPGKGKGKGKRRGKSTVTTVTRRLDVDRTARAVAKRAFAAADTDGSGTIDFDEFSAFLSSPDLTKAATEEHFVSNWASTWLLGAKLRSRLASRGREKANLPAVETKNPAALPMKTELVSHEQRRSTAASHFGLQLGGGGQSVFTVVTT